MGMWLSLLELLGLAWWIEIDTSDCTYFFGPFSSKHEALDAQPGYLEDLEEEGATSVQTNMRRMRQPSQLTIEKLPASIGNVRYSSSLK
ncbi:MAG: DUF1816 domain-containing protein [Leptolyngbyaceae bacterium]|nr:DUF1816 domain-containing protein [Leptolyngbyaceae bacterium]